MFIEDGMFVTLPAITVTFVPLGLARVDCDLTYQDEQTGETITVPAGTLTDGMSSPSWTWALFGHPYSLSVLPATILHDALLQGTAIIELPNWPYSRAEARRVFYDALRALGRGRFRAWWLRAGVYVHDTRLAMRDRHRPVTVGDSVAHNTRALPPMAPDTGHRASMREMAP